MNFKFETPEEKRKRLVQSILEKRGTGASLTEEEKEFIKLEEEEDKEDLRRTYRL